MSMQAVFSNPGCCEDSGSPSGVAALQSQMQMTANLLL